MSLIIPQITIDTLRTLSPRELKDIPEATEVISEIGPFGVKLAVIMPVDNFEKLIRFIRAAQDKAHELVGMCHVELAVLLPPSKSQEKP